MDEQENLDQIPDNWFDLIDPGERDELAAEITEQLMLSFAQKLGLKDFSPDDIIQGLSKTEGINEEEAASFFQHLVREKVKLELFNTYWADRVLTDEFGRVVFTPKVIAKMFGISDLEAKQAVEANKEKLEELGHNEFDEPETEFES